jgi:DNA-binding response OmpR family regulator
MLTARDDEVDRLAGLDVGADDYIGKPFSPKELVARMKAVLRRAEPHREQREEQLLLLGDVVLWRSAREVTVAGNRVELRMQEFDLLAYLMENRGLFSRVRCCSNGFGDSSTPAGRGRWTCTSRSCAASLAARI